MNTKTSMFNIIIFLIVSICITACTQEQTNNLNYKFSTKFDAEKIRPFEESNIEIKQGTNRLLPLAQPL